MEIAKERHRAKSRKKIRPKTDTHESIDEIQNKDDIQVTPIVLSAACLPGSTSTSKTDAAIPQSPTTIDTVPPNSECTTPTVTTIPQDITLTGIANSSLERAEESSEAIESTNSQESTPEEVTPTAPELPSDIPSTLQAAPPLITVMQGLDLLKQRQAAACTEDLTHSKAQCSSNIMKIELVRNSKTESKVRSVSIDCWSSLERARMLFGTKHMETAQICIQQFYESGERFVDHQELLFAKLLEEYKDSMKMVYRKKSEILLSESECEAALASLWRVESREESAFGACSDGRSMELKVRMKVATWNRGEAPKVWRRWNESLENIASDFCVHQHTSLVTKYNLEECLHAELTDPTRLRSALSLLFSHLNTSDAVPALHAALAGWTYFTAHRLLTIAPDFTSLMLLINHLVRQTKSIRWALPLVQIEIETTDDAQKTFAALATILNCSRIQPDHVSEAAEATEQTIKADVDDWTVVEQLEGQELSERAAACALSEQDLLGLLTQLPVAATLRRLVLLRAHATPEQLRFTGDASSGRAVLKSLCGAWELIEVLRRGLRLHAAYRDVCDWLCRLLRLTLHCMADLYAATWSECTDEMRGSIGEGLELVFHVCWQALEESTHRDMALSYAANLPFHVLSDHNLTELYRQVTSTVELADTLECYHNLCCIASMAESRPFGLFAVEAATYLFQLGMSGTSSGAERGGWARGLLSRLMRRHPDLYVHVLIDIAKLRLGVQQQYSDTWLQDLQLQLWRPTRAQLHSVLAEWNTPEGLRALLSNLIENPQREIHHELAARIVCFARSLAADKGSVPDWMYQALVDLKLHAVDWQEDLNAVTAPSESILPDVTPEEENPLVCMWTVLTTSWGHSLPLICEYGVEMLKKLAAAGRHREVAFCLHYLLIVMVQSPESIEHTPGFKSLLAIMLSASPSLASRLFGRQTANGAQLLQNTMRTHLLDTYILLEHDSPRGLLQCWLHLLTGPEDWATNPAILSLLETALSCCSLHPDATQAAREHFRDCLKKSSSKSWPITRSPETPHVWLAQLSAHHELERASGLWNRLLWELHRQRDSRVHVDKAVEKCGGGLKGEDLTIYQAANAILACSISHPVHLQLWHLLLTLYLDRPIDAQPNEFVPTGPLFFRGLFKSRVLGQLTRRLQDASRYHAECLKEFRLSLERLQALKSDIKTAAEKKVELKEVNQSIQYHMIVLKKLQEYMSLLDDRPGVVNRYQLTTLPIPESLHTASLTRSPLESLRTATRRVSLSVWPTLAAPWHLTSRDSYSELEPVERMIRRLKDLPAPLPLRQPALERSQLLPSDTAGPRQLSSCIETCLKQLASHAREFGLERTTIKTLDCRMWELLPQLYVARPFVRQEQRSCGDQCTGHVTLTVRGTEWCLSPGVEHELAEVARGRRTRLEALTSPRQNLAKLCAALDLAVRRSEYAGAALTAFDSLVKYSDGRLNECPPICDAIRALTVRLGEQYVSGDANRCARLVSVGSSGGLASAVLQPSLLPVREFPRVYSAILQRHRAIQSRAEPAHVIFSYLSKFDVRRWCNENEDLIGLRAELLENVVEALGRFATEPAGEDMVLVELLSRHMALLASGRELGRCLELVTRAAAAATLPVAVWPHLEAAVKNSAEEFDIHQLSSQQQTASAIWWEARKHAAPTSALGSRAPHALPAASVARAYTAASLKSLARITMEPAQRGVMALRTLLSWWDAWLQPWWGEPASPQAPPVLPWGANDESLGGDMLMAFVDDVLTIMDDCKGGECDVLRHVLWWVSTTQCGGDICRYERAQRWACSVWRELLRLSWREHEWFHLSCLPAISQMCTSGDQSRNFCVTILRDTKSWLPPELPPRDLSCQLANLVHLLTDLPFPIETLEHAANSLPWHHLEMQDLELPLELYFQRNHTMDKPAHTRDSFRLLCAACTLAKSYNTQEPTQTSHSKRISLIARYTRALGETLATAGAEGQAAAREAVAEGLDVMLRAVDETCCCDDEQASIQYCSVLLEPATELLRRQTVSTAQKSRWSSRILREGSVATLLALKIVDPYAGRICEYKLSDNKVQSHLNSKGTWGNLLQHRSDQNFDDVGEKLSVGCLYEAYATVLGVVQSGRADPEYAAGVLLKELAAVKLDVNDHEVAVVMILDFIIHTLRIDTEIQNTSEGSATISDTNVEQASAAQENASDWWATVCTLLQPWSESARFQLLKKITLQATCEPSDSFRLWCKMALCVAISAREQLGRATPADLVRYNAIVSEMSEIARTKMQTVLGRCASSCRDWLNDKGALLASRGRLTQLALLLYPQHATYLQTDTTTLP